ncbi:MAG: DEAD/DEAH box helicase [Bacteroidota bacterium]|nr:DEAD/DEAH box helicase [Bacteroidota bacterium]MDE2833580.1 DEAD/DEAH box helicase [Bacteroidota bacterium]MDE2956740.1 DEAD/DEAH box helicase [Bacteroidota bacterium]
MNSPVSASKGASQAFELLVEPVRKWIWQQQWTQLRDIQEEAIPFLLKTDQDLVIAAPTASGKTEAAFLPLISKVQSRERRAGFDLVYVSPLRALINDQFRRLEDLCQSLELPVYPWHGDVAQSIKARAKRNPSGILLITPESLEAMFVLRGQEIPSLFTHTQAVVIDELHTLLDNERGMHLRSLLARLELSVGHRIRRVGLSATLGDMDLVCASLRPEDSTTAHLLASKAHHQELRLQVRAYTTGEDPNDPEQTLSAERSIGMHIFENFRGSNNLVFANARKNVELYSDLLRRICERSRLPNEFFPHHGSLSRELRNHVEDRLKEGRLPVTAICTSTLELGIDIGAVRSVGQIGAPWSVASLRQRLGRSGRKAGQPAILRMYAVEEEPGSETRMVESFHLQLVRSIALIELLRNKWYEPPRSKALHLSTLTHQILSVIAERGGASARRLFVTLCERGPFQQVSAEMFVRLLRQMGSPETQLIEQAPGGALLLGCKGEQLVEHYTFYAVFNTPQEYRLIHSGRTLGTVPIQGPMSEGQAIIFAGKRWAVVEVDHKRKVVVVEPEHAGKPPLFGGTLGAVHAMVIRRMREILLEDTEPRYLDGKAMRLLSSARAAYRSSGLDTKPVLERSKGEFILAPWTGSVQSASLAIVLVGIGYKASRYDGILEVSKSGEDLSALIGVLMKIGSASADLEDLVRGSLDDLCIEKYHPFLGEDLLLQDNLTRHLDLEAVPAMARDLCARMRRSPGGDGRPVPLLQADPISR